MASSLNADNGVVSGSAGLKSSADSTGVLALQTNGTTAVTIDTAQNVGIGTSSPDSLTNFKFLDVGSGSTNQGVVQANNGTVKTAIYSNGTDGYVATRTSHNLNFQTGGSTRAIIDTSGNLLVGTTSGGDKVTIKGGDGNQLSLDNAGTQYTSMYVKNNGTIKTSIFWDNNVSRFIIVPTSGGVYLNSGGTSWVSASDERVKDVIEPIENATQKLSAWRAVIGKYKTDEEGVRRSFLMAQDVLSTFPEAVDTADESESGLRYQDTIPVLVKAIQEQQAIITTLTQRVEALEGAK